MAEPVVSVIIPTLNRPELLRVALESLTLQTMRHFEVIVVNDGGENPASTVESFRDRLHLTLLEHARCLGLSAARNTGLRAARGRYLSYLDDDDFYYEDHLETLLVAATAQNCPVVYGDALRALQRRVGGEYRTVSRRIPLSRDFDRKELGERNITPVLCVMHERACLARTGGFAEFLRGHEDWDFWQRLARHYDFRHVSIPVAEFLARPDGETLSSRKDTMAESWRFVRAQGALFARTPPVVSLERAAKDALCLGRKNAGPVEVSVIVPCADLGAATRRRLLALCPLLEDAQLVVVATADPGEAGEYKTLLDRQLRVPCLLVCNRGEVGRILAANQGAAAATGELLVFLEETVRPAAPGWLAALMRTAASPMTGAVGGVFEDAGRGLIAGGAFKQGGELIFRRASSAVDAGVSCLPDLCLLIRRSLFLEMGGFDLAFAPGHYADADLCLRLRERGFSCLVAGDARLIWNAEKEPVSLSAAGLIARRALWERWQDGRGNISAGRDNEAFRLAGEERFPFPMERAFTTGDWPLRAVQWPSDGAVPRSFEFPLPAKLRA